MVSVSRGRAHDLGCQMLTSLVLLVGNAYAVGGVIRALAGSYLDREAVRGDRWRQLLAAVGGSLTFASGVSFLLLSRWSPLLAACNALVQLLYLDWAPRTALMADEAQRTRRTRATRAVIADVNLVLLALLLESVGFWRELTQPPVLELAIIAAPALAASLAQLAFPRETHVSAGPMGPAPVGSS